MKEAEFAQLGYVANKPFTANLPQGESVVSLSIGGFNKYVGPDSVLHIRPLDNGAFRLYLFILPKDEMSIKRVLGEFFDAEGLADITPQNELHAL